MFKNEIIERNKNIKRNFSVVFDFILFIYNVYNFYFLLLLYIMAKSRKNVLKPVTSGLTSVGRVAKKSLPIIDKGVSSIYDTMGKGFDLGVKSVKSVSKRTRKIAGGRRRKSNRRRR
jgi:hypothetical protein